MPRGEGLAHRSHIPGPVTMSKDSILLLESVVGESIHMPDNGGLTADALVNHVKRSTNNELVAEFISIDEEPKSATYLEAAKEENLYYRNRYYNVLSMDHSRVRINSGTYINANFADGYKQKNAYIAAQGPLDETFTDFWEMIWEQSVMTIAMATRLAGEGRFSSLCGEYWPRVDGQVDQYGEFEVRNKGIEKQKDLTVTALVLQNLTTGESRDIAHLQFTGWPDYDVPSSAAAFLSFLSRVRQSQLEAMERQTSGWTGHPLGPPILVHCSAGIGRTGTFCTVDISLQRLVDIGTVDITGTLQKLRSQRSLCIQTHQQYVFTYLAILEHCSREGLLKDKDSKAYVKRLCENFRK
ncbi:tyrosine-protein phosphatase non-receptor type 9-like [Lineus longissimus]|uniref:tyrosine-protein phosphatase non-receptor type 9-like n=1 Tax=Lineus longissimus TaxID=88925 RepID=UPI002B4EEE97